jgi:hypothetical protein
MHSDFGSSPLLNSKKNKINTNRPNAESLSNHHSRKSSNITREILQAHGAISNSKVDEKNIS